MHFVVQKMLQIRQWFTFQLVKTNGRALIFFNFGEKRKLKIFYKKRQHGIKIIELESSAGVNFDVRELMNSQNIGNCVYGAYERI